MEKPGPPHSLDQYDKKRSWAASLLQKYWGGPPHFQKFDYVPDSYNNFVIREDKQKKLLVKVSPLVG